MSNNRRYIYNYYHSRGYEIKRSNDGNHKPGDHGNPGYGAVGCSRGLPNKVLDSLISSPYLYFDSNDTEKVSSLYLYPGLIDSWLRCAVIGQTVTHAKNCVSDSPNFFSHNMLVGFQDFFTILSQRTPGVFLRHKFKDTYVDKRPVKENELFCDDCIDDPVEFMDFIRDVDNGRSFMPQISSDLARAMIFSLFKPDTHLVISLNTSAEKIDTAAREILYSVYSWFPQKMLQNMGFLTNWNGAKVPDICKFIFCPRSDLKKLSNMGLGSIRGNTIIHIDAENPINDQINERQMGVHKSDLPYINWLCSCMTGGAAADDQRIRSLIDSIELKIEQKEVSFSVCSCIYNYVTSQSKYASNNSEESLRAFGMSAFALLNKFASGLKKDIPNIYPFVGPTLEHEILDGKLDNLLLEIDSHYPTLLNTLSPLFSADVNTHISSIRIFRSSLTKLKDLIRICEPHDIPLIIAGARRKYIEKSYNVDESPLGYDIAMIALERMSWNDDLQQQCQELLARSFAASKDFDKPVFKDVRNFRDFLKALRAIKLSKGNVDVNDCTRIISDSTLSVNKKPNEIALTLLENTLPTSPLYSDEWAIPLLKVIALFLIKLSISDDYAILTLKEFSKKLIPTEKYSAVWSYYTDLLSQLYTKSVADGKIGLAIFDDLMKVNIPEEHRTAFSQGISKPLTIQLIINTLSNEKGHNKGYSKNQLKQFSNIYSDTFKSCSVGNISGSAVELIKLIRNDSIFEIGTIKIVDSVSDKYRSVPPRERASLIESICQQIAETAEFKAFWNELGINRVPVYVRWNGSRGAVENIYRAFAGDEYRENYIKERIKEVEKEIDLFKLGAFTNDGSASMASFGQLISEKKGGSKLFKDFSSLITDMINEKKERLSSGTDEYCVNWLGYISLIANNMIYGLEENIKPFGISEIILPDLKSVSNSSILSEICKRIKEAKEFIDDCYEVGKAAPMYDKLLEICKDNRKRLEDLICTEQVSIDPYSELTALLSSETLDEALLLFPDAVEFILRQVEAGKGFYTKTTRNSLSAKLHSGRNAEYSKNTVIDSRLRLYLKKHPRSNVGRWIGAAAAILIVLGAIPMYGIVKNLITKAEPVVSAREWEYTLVESNTLSYYDLIVGSAQSGEVESLYRLTPKTAVTDNKGVKPDNVTVDLRTSSADMAFKKSVSYTDASDAGMPYSIDDSFGQNNNYIRLLIAYVRPVFKSNGQISKIIETEERTVPVSNSELVIVSGTDIVINDGVFEGKEIGEDCEIYVSQLTNLHKYYEAYYQQCGYPKLEDAVRDVRYSDTVASSSDPDNWITIYKNISLDNTIVVDHDVFIKGGDLDKISINRGEHLSDEFFVVEQSAALNLDNIVLDGGSKWVERKEENTVGQESAKLSDSIEVSMTVNSDRGKPGSVTTKAGKRYAAHVVVKNRSARTIDGMSFNIQYDPNVFQFIGEDDTAEVVFYSAKKMNCSPAGNGTVRFSYGSVVSHTDLSDGEQKASSEDPSADESTSSDTGAFMSGASNLLIASKTDAAVIDTIEFDIFFTIKPEAVPETQAVISIVDLYVVSGDDDDSRNNDKDVDGSLRFSGSETHTCYFTVTNKADARIRSLIVTVNGEKLVCPLSEELGSVFYVETGEEISEISISINEKNDADEDLRLHITKCPEILQKGENHFDLSIYGGNESDGSMNENKYSLILNMSAENLEKDKPIRLDEEKTMVNEGLVSKSPIITSFGNVMLGENALLKNNSVEFDGFTAGALAISETGSVDLYGAIVSNNAYSQENCVGGIWNKGRLTLHGSANIAKNYSASDSVAVGGIINDSMLEIDDRSGVINNSADKVGGIYNNGDVTLSGASVSGNTASKEDGVGGILNENGRILLSDGAIISDNAAPYAGGILSYADIYLRDCKIIENRALTVNGYGGIVCEEKAVVYTSESPVVFENYSGDENELNENDLYSEQSIVIDGDMDNAAIGLSRFAACETIAKLNVPNEELALKCSNFFFPDGGDGPCITSGKDEISFTAEAETTHYYMVVSMSGDNGEISFEGKRRLSKEQSLDISFIPEPSYELYDVLINEKSALDKLEKGSNVLRLSSVSNDISIEAYFKPVRNLLQLFYDAEHCDVKLEPDSGDGKYEINTSVMLSIVTDEDYRLTSIEINGSKISAELIPCIDGVYQYPIIVNADTVITINTAVINSHY